MIYVVHVTSGMEYETVQALVMQGIKAYAPKHHLLERRRGEWTTVSRYLFPGYVFADLPQLTDEVYYKVRNTDGVAAHRPCRSHIRNSAECSGYSTQACSA